MRRRKLKVGAEIAVAVAIAVVVGVAVVTIFSVADRNSQHAATKRFPSGDLRVSRSDRAGGVLDQSC